MKRTLIKDGDIVKAVTVECSLVEYLLLQRAVDMYKRKAFNPKDRGLAVKMYKQMRLVEQAER